VGWLEGLFHGIQTALVAQQVAAQSQLTGMRRQLPSGPVPGLDGPAADAGSQKPSTGQYL